MSQNSPKQWFQLEEQFFGQVDQDLLRRLRENMKVAETADAIMSVTGIKNAELAQSIAEKNITVETLSAFRLVPLVAVAWADDRVESDERDVILNAAEKSGIDAQAPAMELLASWTKNRPPVELLDTWCDYAKSLSDSIDEGNRSALREEILGQAKAVAEACGGILGFGSISPGESETLARIEAALS